MPLPKNPQPNQKLTRKEINGTYQNTTNNANDFYLNPPSQSETFLKEEALTESQLKLESIIYPSEILINEICQIPLEE